MKLRSLFIAVGAMFSLAASAQNDIAIDATNFPDANFRAYLSAQSYGQDGVITPEELAGITTINLSKLDTLTTMKGIELFTELKNLTVYQCKMCGTLDVSKNTKLETLNCGYNHLSGLNVSGCTELTELNCRTNRTLTSVINPTVYFTGITRLDVSRCTKLKTLICEQNGFNTLDVSMLPELEKLECHSLNLTTLNLKNCPKLKTVDCSTNALTSLDISNNPELTELNFENNKVSQFTTGDVSALVKLTFNQNNVKEFYPGQFPDLERLGCYRNELTRLDCSNNPKLNILSCYNNQITDLDVSQCVNMKQLHVHLNQLRSLDVTHMPELNHMRCNRNQLTSLDLSQAPKMGMVLDAYLNEQTLSAPMMTIDNGTRVGVFLPNGAKAECIEGLTIGGRAIEEPEIVAVGDRLFLVMGSDAEANGDFGTTVSYKYNTEIQNERYAAARMEVVISVKSVLTYLDETNRSGDDYIGSCLLEYTAAVPEGVQVYAGSRVSADRQQLYMLPYTRDIPMEKAFVVRAAEPGFIEFEPLSGMAATPESQQPTNILKASREGQLFSTVRPFVFGLDGDSRTAGVWTTANGYVPARTAYLEAAFLGQTDNRHGLTLNFDEGNATGISPINNEQLTMNNSIWYTIGGQRLTTPPTQKGIYLHNGKKVVVK